MPETQQALFAKDASRHDAGRCAALPQDALHLDTLEWRNNRPGHARRQGTLQESRENDFRVKFWT